MSFKCFIFRCSQRDFTTPNGYTEEFPTPVTKPMCWAGGDSSNSLFSPKPLTSTSEASSKLPLYNLSSLKEYGMSPTGDSLAQEVRSEDLHILSNTLNQISKLSGYKQMTAHGQQESFKPIMNEDTSMFTGGMNIENFEQHKMSKQRIPQHHIVSSNSDMPHVFESIKPENSAFDIYNQREQGFSPDSEMYSSPENVSPVPQVYSQHAQSFQRCSPEFYNNSMFRSEDSHYRNTQYQNNMNANKPLRASRNNSPLEPADITHRQQLYNPETNSMTKDGVTIPGKGKHYQQAPWQQHDTKQFYGSAKLDKQFPQATENFNISPDNFSGRPLKNAVNSKCNNTYLNAAQLNELQSWFTAQKNATGLAPAELLQALTYRPCFPTPAFVRPAVIGQQYGSLDQSYQYIDPQSAFYADTTQRNSTLENNNTLPPFQSMMGVPYGQANRMFRYW